ncbi:MAG: nucleotide exchange factor GrpE [Gemmatales bacterium]|nr:nucleotide exchange factor GrpE [Gemmatales bacterium]
MSEQASRPSGSERANESASAGNTTSAEASPPDNAEAAQVLADLEQLSRERDTFKELLLRTRADFENYQKRVAKERDQERRFALWPLALDLLSVLDNLQRALDSVQEDSPLRQGVVMIFQQLQNILQKYGIVPMEAQGQPFDPHLHQAVMQQPDTAHPPNTVIKVLESGYYYHDRVLRPARVVVSVAPPASERSEPTASSA